MPPVLLEDMRISRYAAVRPRFDVGGRRSDGVPTSARENVEGVVEAFRGGME